jgi:hypothetical protein
MALNGELRKHQFSEEWIWQLYVNPNLCMVVSLLDKQTLGSSPASAGVVMNLYHGTEGGLDNLIKHP